MLRSVSVPVRSSVARLRSVTTSAEKAVFTLPESGRSSSSAKFASWSAESVPDVVTMGVPKRSVTVPSVSSRVLGRDEASV